MMHRARVVWIALPVLSLVFLGCPKKAPTTPAEEIEIETKDVPKVEEVREAPAPPVEDKPVDPFLSEDLQLVNEEAVRRGLFHPNVYFDFDKFDLKPEAREKLAQNADFLKRHSEFIVTIEGHCDERGTHEYNLALGERRASAAKGYLVSLGISGDRLRTISYGKERPVCTESNESCWWRNRRAYMIISGRTGRG